MDKEVNPRQQSYQNGKRENPPAHRIEAGRVSLRCTDMRKQDRRQSHSGSAAHRKKRSSHGSNVSHNTDILPESQQGNQIGKQVKDVRMRKRIEEMRRPIFIPYERTSEPKQERQGNDNRYRNVFQVKFHSSTIIVTRFLTIGSCREYSCKVAIPLSLPYTEKELSL